jgi:tetratricopeptide (TPR) repeat protein
MVPTARVARAIVIGGLAAAALGLPSPSLAQGDRFARAVADFRTAAPGVYGDEGPRLRSLVDEMSSALSAWIAPPRSAKESLPLALSFLQRHRFADALDVLETGADLVPDDPRLHLLRGLALEQLDRVEEAGGAFERAFATNRSDPVTAYLSIAAAPRESNVDRALETLQALEGDVLRGDVGRAVAPFVSVAVFGTGNRTTPVLIPYRYAAGFALFVRGEHEAGVDRLREAVSRDPLVVDPAAGSDELGTASSALRRRDVAVALAALNAARVRFPESSETHRLLSLVYGLTGDLVKSVEHAQAALDLRPDDERTWIELARLHSGRGDDAEAKRTLDRATQALPESGALQSMLASAAYRLEQTGEALAAYTAAARAVGISGRDDLLRSVAFLYNEHQDLARAIEATQERVRMSRNDPVAHRELAALYTNDGRHARAYAELVVAAWLAPHDPHTFAALGRTHIALGRPERAVDALRRAVSLEPKLPRAYYGLAQALVRTGRRADSSEYLTEFHRMSVMTRELEGQARRIVTVRRDARLHAAEGRYERAVDEFRTLIALEPRSAQNHIELAQILEQAGRLEDSLEWLTAASKLESGADVHRRIADLLSRLGRTDESEKARGAYQSLRFQDMEARRP